MDRKPSPPLVLHRARPTWFVWLLLAGGLGLSVIAWLVFFRPEKLAGQVNIPAGVVSLQPLTASHIPAGPGAGAGGLAPAAKDHAIPAAVLPEAFFDFGRIPADKLVQREFYINNSGEGSLLIQRAYTTCSCTRAEISSVEIPPGKWARINVLFDPGVHNVAGTTVRRGLVLETNDPLHPVIEIWVQASVAGKN